MYTIIAMNDIADMNMIPLPIPFTINDNRLYINLNIKPNK